MTDLDEYDLEYDLDAYYEAQEEWFQDQVAERIDEVPSEVYGHWERAERKREAQMMEGVFGV